MGTVVAREMQGQERAPLMHLEPLSPSRKASATQRASRRCPELRSGQRTGAGREGNLTAILTSLQGPEVLESSMPDHDVAQARDFAIHFKNWGVEKGPKCSTGCQPSARRSQADFWLAAESDPSPRPRHHSKS